jgi:Protein of unknown function (DUF3054)
MTVLGRDATPLGRTTLLLAGDVAALATFAILGRRSHQEATGWDAIGGVLETALPFIVGWIVAAWLLGAFTAEHTGSLRAIVQRTALAWLLAFPLAVVGRAVLLGRGSPWTFYLVAFSVAFLMLACWRLLFALAEQRWPARR